MVGGVCDGKCCMRTGTTRCSIILTIKNVVQRVTTQTLRQIFLPVSEGWDLGRVKSKTMG